VSTCVNTRSPLVSISKLRVSADMVCCLLVATLFPLRLAPYHVTLNFLSSDSSKSWLSIWLSIMFYRTCVGKRGGVRRVLTLTSFASSVFSFVFRWLCFIFGIVIRFYMCNFFILVCMVQEWTVVDGETGMFTLVTASSQREAVKRTLDDDVVPGRSSDVRPRTGTGELMEREVFEEFMRSVYKGWSPKY